VTAATSGEPQVAAQVMTAVQELFALIITAVTQVKNGTVKLGVVFLEMTQQITVMSKPIQMAGVQIRTPTNLSAAALALTPIAKHAVIVMIVVVMSIVRHPVVLEPGCVIQVSLAQLLESVRKVT